MFDSLDEQMKHDDDAAVSSRERILKWAAYAVVSVLAFGGLFYAVRMLS